MTSMPVSLVKGLKAYLRNASETIAAPSIEADGLGCPGSDGSAKGDADQADGGAGKSEVFEKVTSAEFAVLIQRRTLSIQFFFGYDGHRFSFQLMVVRL
jgi:hypothetical protein